MPVERDETVSLVGVWPAGGVEGLTDLVLAADPDSHVTSDDLLGLWNETEHSVVFGIEGVAAIAGYLDGRSARLTLLAVDPQFRRRGIARRLAGRFEEWSVEHDAADIVVGAPLDRGPWPGIDGKADDLHAFFAELGYRVSPEPAIRCQTVAPRFRAEPPADVEIVRVLSGAAVDETRSLVSGRTDSEQTLVDLAIEQGTCLVGYGLSSRRPLGAVLCHSVVRSGWIGPLIVVGDPVDPELMASLVGAACVDLMVSGRSTAHVIDGVLDFPNAVERLGAVDGPAFFTAVKSF